MDEWHIGDPVDWGDGFMDAQNWGRGGDEEKKEPEWHKPSKNSKLSGYSKKAWDCYLEDNYKEALYYINLALDLNKFNSNNWNIKAIILQYMGMYNASERCYDKSLQLRRQSIVADNKARMLLSWAYKLLEESKNEPNPLPKLNEALKKNEKAINAFSGENDDDNIERFFFQKDSIEFYIRYVKKYLDNIEILKKYDKNVLFTITGTGPRVNVNLGLGVPLKLVKEPDNEFDSDAIAVYAEGEKIGYVANKEYTKFELTSSASDLHDKIQDTAQAEYLCYLDKFLIQFHTGRII